MAAKKTAAQTGKIAQPILNKEQQAAQKRILEIQADLDAASMLPIGSSALDLMEKIQSKADDIFAPVWDIRTMMPRVSNPKSMMNLLDNIPLEALLKVLDLEKLLNSLKYGSGKVVDGAAYDVYEYEITEQIMKQYDPELLKLMESARLKPAGSYSEALVKFLEGKEGFQPIAYNNGKTIGYGFDFYLYPNIKINYNKDGKSISKTEGERLLKIMLDKSKNQINTFLSNQNLQVDQNTFDALTDLFYNRNSNYLTQQVAVAMAHKDDKQVLALLKDFDYRYALAYLCPKGDTKCAQSYVNNNPGLKTRRAEEYNGYKNGF